MIERIRINSEHILLQLDRTELLTVLEDVKDCRELLKPQIEIVDSFIQFRNEDLKMLVPEEFFNTKINIYKVSATLILTYLLIMAVSMGVNIRVGYLLNLELAAMLYTTVGAFLFAGLGCLCNYLLIILDRKQKIRLATYAKAKCLAFFYMTVKADLTNNCDRLQRSCKTTEQNYHTVKSMHAGLIACLDEKHISSLKGQMYPDGTPVLPEKIRLS